MCLTLEYTYLNLVQNAEYSDLKILKYMGIIYISLSDIVMGVTKRLDEIINFNCAFVSV
jgi:hypothetical protein